MYRFVGRDCQVPTVWESFRAGFLELWKNEDLHKGQAYLRAIYPDAIDLEEAQAHYMQRLWQVKMMRFLFRLSRGQSALWQSPTYSQLRRQKPKCHFFGKFVFVLLLPAYFFTLRRNLKHAAEVNGPARPW